MEPGGIGSADRLPASALRASAARQGSAAQPADAETVLIDKTVDSAYISPEARALPIVSETVAAGQQRALEIIDEKAPPEGSGLPEPQEIETMAEDALQANTDNLTIIILLRRLSTEHNPRTRHALLEQLTRHYERLRSSGLRDDTFSALLDTGRALFESGHVAEARQIYILLANTPEEGLSEDAAYCVNLARAGLRPMSVMPPIAARRGTLTFIPLDQATMPPPTEQLPIRDPRLAMLLQFPATRPIPAEYMAQVIQFARMDTFFSEDFIIVPSTPQSDPALTQYVIEYLATDAGQQLLTDLGITDIHTMTLEQATQLANRIVSEHLSYANSIPLRTEIPEDSMSALDMLQNGNAICRHYAFALSAVFGVLREQAPSQLGNSYMITVGGRGNDVGSERTIGHSWNFMFTQVSADEWIIQVLDPSGYDDDNLALDATSSASFGVQMELVVSLANHGVISREQAMQWLENFIEQNPSSPRIPFAHWYLANLYPAGSPQRLAHLQEIPTDSPLYDNAVALAGGHLPAGPAAQGTAIETPLPPGTPPAPAEPEPAEAPTEGGESDAEQWGEWE